MVTMTATEWVRLLVENAGALRASGVMRVKAGEFEADIAPEVPDLGEMVGSPDYDHGSPDPLDDPATYGGSLPTFRRPE